MIYIDDSMHLPARASAPRAKHYAPVVVMDPKRTMYQGQLMGDAFDLTDRLTAAGKRIREDLDMGRGSKRDPPDPTLVYFEIDGAVTWDRVVTAVDAGAAAGFTHPSFAFAVPVTAQPPPRTWVDDKLDEMRKKTDDAGNRATELANLTRGIIDGCPALVKVYGRVGSEEGENKAVTIVEGTGPALIECGCKPDIPALRSVMYGILGNPHPSGVIAVQLAKAGKKLEQPATATWADASKALAAGDVVTFTVR